MLNFSLIVLQTIPPLCDYKVWIDTKRGANVKCHLCNMVELNMMEEFHAHRMAKRKRTAYFTMQHEMDCEEYKEKREEERAKKRERI
jgi:putative sterol carrier protein